MIRKIFWKRLGKQFLDFILPQFCLVCDSPGEILCNMCLKRHKSTIKQRCPACDKPVAKGLLHKTCEENCAINRLLVGYKYGRLEKQLLYRLKYKNNKDCARIISELLQKKFRKKSHFKGFVCIPIPLHKKRKRVRGYNQVELIAQHFCFDYDINIQKDLLIRQKNTQPQNKLNKHERQHNLRNAFTTLSDSSIPKQVLILDDLTTSGATFQEAAKALKEAGVENICCLAFARGK